MSILAFEKLGKHYTINLASQGHDTLCDQLSYGFQSLIAMNTCFGSSFDNLSVIVLFAPVILLQN
jgi:hypothetical protein